MTSNIVLPLLVSAILRVSNAQEASTTSYQLVKKYTGQNFFDNFAFFSDRDPTNGFVKYVDLETANQTGLAGFASSDSFDNAIYLGVDWWSLNVTPDGRPSTRVESKDTFNHSLWIADIKHMPGGICGSWPAYWLLGEGARWPQAGEIDIMEGINKQTVNKMVLHADTGVSIFNVTGATSSNQTQMRGTLSSLDCSLDTAGSTGCVAEGSWNDFGTDYNAAGGSVLATEFTSDAIRIWNFQRGSVPSDIAAGSPDPEAAADSWGPPDAMFVSSGNGTFDEHFFNLKIIFNTALCGDWIDKTWNTSECASVAPTCQDYVTNNPAVFKDAYWAIGGVQVYQQADPSCTGMSTPLPSNRFQPCSRAQGTDAVRDASGLIEG
ncbi:putative endo-1,3(4)-beta-glucanase [Exophiala dermatitidis]